ncbi:MAG: hydroxyisourate hydrolase [Gammaproteobacteria bacterium]|nr:hydroxyisourate hydrolase [Gammaproteobacteria bacterium]
MGRLTTHVLNTARGIPAVGVMIELYRLPGVLLASRVTGSDGRCDKPLLEEATMESGEYELLFHIGEYFRRQGENLPSPAFLDTVVIRIGIADIHAHYHVPLLLSPWGYSTYRGS